MTATVTSVTDTGTFAKCGVMFRDSLDPSAAHAMIYVTPDNLVVFHWRLADGTDCSDVYSPGDVSGTVTSSSFARVMTSADTTARRRATWAQLGTTKTIAMGDTIQAALRSALGTQTGLHCDVQERDHRWQQGFRLDRPRHRRAEHRGSCVCSSEFEVRGTRRSTRLRAGNDIGGYSDQGNSPRPRLAATRRLWPTSIR